jgi:1,4-alpha-glucan branching enzyme
VARDIDPSALTDILAGTHHEPHAVLGPHVQDGGVVVRVLRPFATSIVIQTLEETFAAVHVEDAMWEAELPGNEVPDYRVRVTYDGEELVSDDPYRFLPTLGELDLHLIREGRHERLWDVLGAHVRTYPSVMGEVQGTSFSVWAPNARAVRVVGEFNHWQGVGHAMRSLGSSGVWELFIPGVTDGAHYKFEILGKDGHWKQQADPMARRTEVPPHTASIVTSSEYDWNDESWLDQRAKHSAHDSPMSVYEVHLGSWKQGLSYRDLADELVAYVRDLGFTHLELMPVMEHPFGGSWGYQVTSYYAPTSRFGDPDDLRYFIDRAHQEGIGVILDWVPGHFPKDAWALGRFDGTPLYEHPDPLRGEQPDWGTFIFDFGRAEVRNFLVANALYWLQEFHADGLRVDAVASMLYLDYSREAGQWRPNIHGGRENLDAIAFLQEANATARNRDGRGGVNRVARGDGADLPGGSRLRHQVEHGVDERHLALPVGRTDSSLVPPPHRDVLAHVRVLRALHAAAEPRRGRSRQGFSLRAHARRPLAEDRGIALVAGLSVVTPWQEAHLHGRRVRPSIRVVGGVLARLVAH